MFEQLPAPDHVLALRPSGKITRGDIRRDRGLLQGLLEKDDRISVEPAN